MADLAEVQFGIEFLFTQLEDEFRRGIDQVEPTVGNCPLDDPPDRGAGAERMLTLVILIVDDDIDVTPAAGVDELELDLHPLDDANVAGDTIFFVLDDELGDLELGMLGLDEVEDLESGLAGMHRQFLRVGQAFNGVSETSVALGFQILGHGISPGANRLPAIHHTRAAVSILQTYYRGSLHKPLVKCTLPLLHGSECVSLLYCTKPQGPMTDPLYQMFGSRVRALRERKNVTQEELGRRIDLSRTSIVNIEKGRQRVLLHQVVEIADALDAKPAELLPKASPIEKGPQLRDDVALLVESLEAEKRST